MKKYIAVSIAVLALCLALILFGCGDGGGGSTSGGGNNNIPTPNYIPHTLGSTWTYSNTKSGVTTSYTNVVTQTTDTHFTMSETVQSIPGTSKYSCVLSNGVWMQAKDVDHDAPGVTDYTAYATPIPILPSVIIAGTHETYTSAWHNNTGKSGTITVDYTVAGLESVTVPAGTFANALKIIVTTTITDGSNTTTSASTAWYADGVGNIKRVDNTTGETDELLSYTISSSAAQQAQDWPVIDVTSDITSATTWTSGNVYVIGGSGISVKAPLTIEPGTVIKFKPGTDLGVSINGSIFASGTAERPIIFTSFKDDAAGGDSNGDGTATAPAGRDWRHIDLFYGGSGSSFNYCQFYYAGGGSAPNVRGTLLLYDHSVTVTNSVFAFNKGGNLSDVRGGTLDAENALAGTVITGNTFYANDLPLIVSAKFDLDASNTFHDTAGIYKNTYNGVFVESSGSSQGGKITSVITWSETEVPYVLWNNRVEAGGALTLADNVVLKFANGSTSVHILDGGALNVGTGAKFTSIHDDSLLGDTNANGSATTPAKGDWAGIYYSPSFAPGGWSVSPHYADWSNILYATNTSHTP